MSEKKIDTLLKDPICQKWISYSTAEDSDHPAEWFKSKQNFWEENKDRKSGSSCKS
jgi:uncharacterized short protein YbdD (DUF466 family)